MLVRVAVDRREPLTVRQIVVQSAEFPGNVHRLSRVEAVAGLADQAVRRPVQVPLPRLHSPVAVRFALQVREEMVRVDRVRLPRLCVGPLIDLPLEVPSSPRFS